MGRRRLVGFMITGLALAACGGNDAAADNAPTSSTSAATKTTEVPAPDAGDDIEIGDGFGTYEVGVQTITITAVDTNARTATAWLRSELPFVRP